MSVGNKNQSRLTRRNFLKKSACMAAGASLMSVLAACTPAPTAAPAEPTKASAPAAKQPVKLVMANMGAIPDGWKQLGADFTKENPNITVEFEGVQANTWAEYFDKLVTQFAAGTPPDTCRIAIEGTQLFASRGLAVPLDEYIAKDQAVLKEYFDDVHPNLVKAMAYKGKQYQLPFTWNGPVIHYNTKIFKEAGIERPKDDWSIEDFMSIAKKLTKGDVFGFGLANAFWGGAIPWLFVAGTDLLNDDWTQSTVNDPKTIEVIQFLGDMVTKEKIAPQPQGFNHNQAFISGKLAMVGNGGGNNRLTYISGGMNDFDILYFPKWRTQVHEFGGTGFPVLKSSKNQDAAWQLTRFLVRKESITFFVNSVAQTPARRSVAYTGWVKSGLPPEHFKIYYDMLDKPSKPVDAPPEYNEIESIFLRYFSLVTAGEQKAAQAMGECQKEISQLLAARPK